MRKTKKRKSDFPRIRPTKTYSMQDNVELPSGKALPQERGQGNWKEVYDILDLASYLAARRRHSTSEPGAGA